jgi:hypothetical protein
MDAIPLHSIEVGYDSRMAESGEKQQKRGSSPAWGITGPDPGPDYYFGQAVAQRLVQMVKALCLRELYCGGMD